jgi:hypothetical protein
MSLRSCWRSQARRFGPRAADGGACVASTCGDTISPAAALTLQAGLALAASHSERFEARRCRYPTGALVRKATLLRNSRERVSNRMRIAAQWSSLNSTSGSAASSFRNTRAR